MQWSSFGYDVQSDLASDEFYNEQSVVKTTVHDNRKAIKIVWSHLGHTRIALLTKTTPLFLWPPYHFLILSKSALDHYYYYAIIQFPFNQPLIVYS